MQDAEAPAPEHRWEPLGLEQVKQLFARVSAPWWIAGGRALDMFLGHETRAHVDIDIAVLRRDQQQFRDALAKWDVQVAHDGAFIPWRRGETITKPEHHEIWARETAAGPWRLELLFEESEGKRWAYRRDPSIGLNVADLGRRDAYGIQFIRPRSRSCTNRTHVDRSTKRTSSMRCPVSMSRRRVGCPARCTRPTRSIAGWSA